MIWLEVWLDGEYETTIQLPAVPHKGEYINITRRMFKEDICAVVRNIAYIYDDNDDKSKIIIYV